MFPLNGLFDDATNIKGSELRGIMNSVFLS